MDDNKKSKEQLISELKQLRLQIDDLRQSETKYRNLFENMAEEVHFWQVVRDETGRIKTWSLVDVNPPALETWGRSSVEEIRGKTTDEIFGPGATEHYLPVVRKIMNEGVPYSFEDYFPHLDKHFRFTSIPLGEYFITTGADITDIRKAHDVLLENKARLEAVFSAIPHVIIEFDKKLRPVRANEAALKAVGFTSLDFTRDHAVKKLKFTHLDGSAVKTENLPTSRVLRGQIVTGDLYSITNADGRKRIISAYAAPLYKDETINGVVALWHDITEWKHAEAALAAKESRYRELLETANSIIIRWNIEGVIHFINEFGLRFFGYSQEELLGQDVMTLVPKVEKTSGRHLNELARDIVLNSEHYTHFQNENIRKDGKIVWVAWTNKAILDEQGNVREILAIGNDITALKDTEKALRANKERMELLATVAERLLRAENPQLIVEELCHLVMAQIDCQFFFNYLVEVSGQGLTLNACAGIPAQTAAEIKHLDFGVAVCGCVARDSQRIIAEDIQRRDDPRTELVKSFGVKAYCCHPLMAQGRLIGTLSFGTKTRPTFFPEEVELMKSVTDQVAVAMQRLKAEKALRESEKRIRTSLGEKEVLLKEIHHRVKNNMQVISSLVSLQADQLQDAAMRAVLLDVIHRVRSMALVHEKLYQSADLAGVEFSEYVQSLLNYLWRAHGNVASKIRLFLDLEPVFLSVNEAVPCGLILNELASNALKHAFDGHEGAEVTVSLRGSTQGLVCLCMGDNGIGLPSGFDWVRARTLGLRLVQMLAGQLHATVELSKNRGTQFTITFNAAKT
jgi:PAS domain S-box-containing protein